MKRLQIMEENLKEYLKLSPKNTKSAHYYILRKNIWNEYWDIVKTQYNDEILLNLTVKLMHIEQEERDVDGFLAENDASAYISFDPEGYLDVIDLFDNLLKKKSDTIVNHQKYFSRLTNEEMVNYHYSIRNVLARTDQSDWYLYTPENNLNPNQEISIIQFPQWSPKYGKSQIASLWFITFSQIHLAQSTFDLIDNSNGLGTMTFNQSALEEFLILLKRFRFSA